MTPTTKLRFVERHETMHPFYKTVDATGILVQSVKTFHVLQQWWVVAGTLPEYHDQYGEWRDVPIEKEKQA